MNKSNVFEEVLAILKRLRALSFILIALAASSTSAAPNLNEHDFSDRVALVLNTFAAVDGKLHPKYRTYRILAQAARGCPKPSELDYIAGLMSEGTGARKIVGTSGYDMFAMPPFVRLLLQFRKCFNTVQIAKITESFSLKIDLFDHGTSNHAILRATTWYLLAENFPDQIWNSTSGHSYSSTELQQEIKKMLLDRTEKYFQQGYDEQASPTYAMLDFFPLLNLVDFAKDLEVRAASVRQATLILALLRANSFHGRLVNPLTRVHAHQRNGYSKWDTTGYPAVTQQLLWLYFGEPAFQKREFLDAQEPFYIIIPALSTWRPPYQLLEAGTMLRSPYTIDVAIPSAIKKWGDPLAPLEVFGSSFISQNFAVGAGNLVFDPAWYYEDMQMFSIYLQNTKGRETIDCYHPYWRSDESDQQWNFDQSSPFQQVYQIDGQGVILFNIPKSDPFTVASENRFFKHRSGHAERLLQEVRCRVPMDIEEIAVTDNSIKIRVSETTFALWTLAGSFAEDHRPSALDGYRYFVVNAPDTAIYFSVLETSDFEDAEREFNQSAIIYQKGKVRFTTRKGDVADVNFNIEKLVDGRVNSLPRVSINGVALNPLQNGVSTPAIKLKNGELSILGASSLWHASGNE